MTDLYMNIYMVTMVGDLGKSLWLEKYLVLFIEKRDLCVILYIFLWLLVSHLHLQIKELSNRNSY